MLCPKIQDRLSATFNKLTGIFIFIIVVKNTLETSHRKYICAGDMHF